MRTAVETTIRAHLQANDSIQETIEWTEIVSRLEAEEPLVPVPRRSNRRGIWVAIAAAVITLLMIGLIPLLISSDESQPADTVAPTTQPADTVTPTTLIPGGPESVSYVATRSWSSGSEVTAREVTVSYLDADVWRMEVTESFSQAEEINRRLFIKDGTDLFEYSWRSDTFTILDLSTCTGTRTAPEVSLGCAAALRVAPIAPNPVRDDSYPLQSTNFTCDQDQNCIGPTSEELWGDCSIIQGDLIAGLAADYYMCQREVSQDGVTTETQTLELWIGADGTTLKWIWIEPRPPGDITPGDETISAYEVSEMDQTPNFDPALFEFECPTETCTGNP